MSHHKSILITRDREGNKALAKKLKRRGAKIISWETFRCVAARSTKKLKKSLQKLACFDWIVFTSPKAVKFFIEHIRRIGPIWIRGENFPRAAVVGPATAKAVRAFGLKVSLVSRVASAKGLASERTFQKTEGLKIFFPKASDARGDFEKKLGCKHRITSCVVYRKKFVKHTQEQIKKLLAQKIDQVVFYSPSAVRAVCKELGAKSFLRLVRPVGLVRPVRVRTMGPTTAQALRECL